MSAPPGFNPDTSLLQQNASAPIVPFRGGGTPISLKDFYQAILKGQPDTIRKALPESIADITNFTISVEDGKFVLKMKVKGKQKKAVATVPTVPTDAAAEEKEKAAAIAAVAASEVANEAKRTEEEIAAVAASEAATKAEAEEAKKREEEEILKQAREFLILEAARAFLRTVGNNVSSEEREGNDEDRGEIVANNENNENNEHTPSNANIKRINLSKIPPHLRGKQSTLTPKPKRSLNEIAAASRAQRSFPLSPQSPLSPGNKVRAEANAMIAAEEEKQQNVEVAQRVVKNAEIIVGTFEKGYTKTTPRGRRGTQVGYPFSVLPPGTGQKATPKNVKQATALQTQLQSTQKP